MANVEIDGVNSKVYTDQVDPKTGTTLTLGTSGDTVSIPSGVTIANSGTSTGFGATLSGSTDNNVVTVTGANAMQGEARLLFDGQNLSITDGGTGAEGKLNFGDAADADVGRINYNHATNYMTIFTNGSEQLRITSAGEVGIGDPDPKGTLHVKSATSGQNPDSDADELIVEGSGHSGISILSGNSSHGKIYFGDGEDNNIGKIQYSHSANGFDIVAGATDVGNWKSNGLGLFCNADTTRLKVETDVDDEKIMQLRHGDADHPYGLEMQYYGGAPNGNDYPFLVCADSAGSKMKIWSNGNVVNVNNSYGTLSDERIKQDITDANSQWEDIKGIKVRNFKLKTDVRENGENALTQIGVVSQELETVSPKLVVEVNPDKNHILDDSSLGTLVDDENNPKCYLPKDTLPEGKKVGDPVLDESGNPTYDKKVGTIHSKIKQVNSSVLYMKAIKALQEAQTRIETLETANTDLATRITALENA